MHCLVGSYSDRLQMYSRMIGWRAPAVADLGLASEKS
eukprot:COSAG01_NODE_32462_length_580_cov_208.324324_1_plen_36_part_10